MTKIRASCGQAKGCLFNPRTLVLRPIGGRYSSTNRRVIRENDIVLLKQKGNDRTIPILTKPLRHDEKIQTGRAPIATNDIIGKAVRDLVSTAKGIEFRIHDPSLGEYTDLSPRLVTPIYSQDTNLIVSLLDLHPSTPDAPNGGGQDKIEIFEAGTGHGALTLNLARAIHAANTAAPPIPDKRSRIHSENGIEGMNEGSEAKEKKEVYHAWRAGRRAVVHTLDQSQAYSTHAQKTVKNFRQGMYFPNVDFHVGSIDQYLSERMSTAKEPFLDHAILDLPNTHQYLEIVGKALKANGSLVTWCPSITQINKCVILVKEEKMPFLLERVIEVGPGLSGGKEWDVRMVMPRALSKVQVGPKTPDLQDDPDAEVERSVELHERPATQEEGWEMICRPKVGVRVIGGGFIALWRKMER